MEGIFLTVWAIVASFACVGLLVIQQRIRNSHTEQKAKLHNQASVANEQLKHLQENYESLSQINLELRETNKHITEASRQYELQAKELSTKLEQLPTLTENFRNISQKIMLDQTELMRKTGKQAVTDSMRPINDQFSQFTKQIGNLHTEAVKEREALKTTVSVLAHNMQEWDLGAKNLTRALTGDQVKIRGDWGELHLEQLLQKIGMKRDVDYLVQPSYTVESKVLRPDFVILMPEGRSVIIDSKVIIKSWLEYSENQAEQNEEENETRLQSFLQQVNLRMQELSNRDYSKIPQLGAVDMTLMFIPIEPAYIAYVQSSFSEAISDSKIALTSPTTLLPILTAIGYIWRLQKQTKNSQNISRQVEQLLKKLDNFVSDFEKIGNQISTASKTYEAAKNKLVSGRGNLINQGTKIINMSGLDPGSLKSIENLTSESGNDLPEEK